MRKLLWHVCSNDLEGLGSILGLSWAGSDWASHAEQSKNGSGLKLDVYALWESIAPRDVVLVMSAAMDQKANKIVLLRFLLTDLARVGAQSMF